MPNKQEFSLPINGEALTPQLTFAVTNPATGDVVAQCPKAELEHLDLAVKAAQKAFSGWSLTSDAQRQQMLVNIADDIEANAESLAALIVEEQGKPLELAIGEVMGGVAWTRYAAEQEIPVEVIEESEEKVVELHRRPIGVVASITPWNWPFMIAIWHIMPALRAGNTVICKPSELTPLNTIRLVEIMSKHLPPGVINLVAGSGELGQAISEHSGISKIVFTGSTSTGQNIMKSSAHNLKRLTLELGGNDAAVILPNTEISKVAGDIFEAAFLNMGQTCAAIKRLYVHESQYDEVCTQLSEIAQKQILGNGMDPETTFGPVQNPNQLNIVSNLVKQAKADGAQVLCGGTQPDMSGYFYPPTIVRDIPNHSRLVQEEQFGPVLPIIQYQNVEQAIEWANDNGSALGGSVWGKDEDQVNAVAARLECGVAWMNCHAQIDPHTPFGGWKMSGIGLEFGLEGLLQYTNQQLMYRKR